MKPSTLALAAVLAVACSPAAPNPGGSPACSGGGLGCLCVSTSCTCTGVRTCTSICGDHCAVACTGAGCNSLRSALATRGGGPLAPRTPAQRVRSRHFVPLSQCRVRRGLHRELHGPGHVLLPHRNGLDDHVHRHRRMRYDVRRRWMHSHVQHDGRLLSCPSGGDCTIPFCPDVVRDCGNGLQVCGRTCPLAR